MRVSVGIDSRSYEIREADPDDSWDRGESGLEFQGVRVHENPLGGFTVDAGVGDTVYVLVEHYEDGSTFGRYHELEVIGTFLTREAAEEATKSADTDHGYFGNHLDFYIEEARIASR